MTIGRHEAGVREILESVLNVSLDGWPADGPLEDAGLYDSLAQLETIARVEQQFGLAEGSLNAEDVGTIDRITGRLAVLPAGVPS